MISLFKRFVFPLITLSLAAPFTTAQTMGSEADCGCHWALAKDISNTIRVESQQLRFLQIIDERMYTEAKSKGGFSLGVPIADDLLAISANWDDFQKKRTQYFTKINYSFDRTLQDIEHFEITSPLAYPVWSDCMKSCAVRSRGGLYSWKEKEDRDAIVVHTYYKIPSTDTKQRVKLTATLKRGASPQTQVFPKNTFINNEETIPVIVDRRERGQDQNSPMLLTFKAGQFAATIDAVWAEPPTPPKITTITTHQQAPCRAARVGLPDDGLQPIYGNKHRFSAHCTAPSGKITRVSVDGYDDYGGCNWITRFTDDPNDDIGKVNPSDAWIRFWTNSSDQCIIRMTVFYDETQTKCDGDNCPGKVPLPSAILHINYMDILQAQIKSLGRK